MRLGVNSHLKYIIYLNLSVGSVICVPCCESVELFRSPEGIDTKICLIILQYFIDFQETIIFHKINSYFLCKKKLTFV